VDELSNWYVRRTRDRFWATRPGESRQSSADAFATLDEALRRTALLLAPFAPFLSDWLHRALSEGDSAHLADFPGDRGRRDEELEREMADARELAALGRAARERAGLRVRQPLRVVKVVLPRGRRLSEEVAAQLREELNVKTVEFLDETAEVLDLRVKPDFSALGPRFGSDAPRVAEAVEGLDAAAAARLRSGDPVTVSWDGSEAEVGPDEVHVVEEARGDLAVGSGKGYMAALDPALDDALRREGLAREVVNRVQRLRRDAGLEVSDRIELAVSGDPAVEEATEVHREYIAGETLALRDGEIRVSVGEGADGPGSPEHTEDVEIEGHSARIGLRRAR
jgi:isoleucyl-tRNA synthetase